MEKNDKNYYAFLKEIADYSELRNYDTYYLQELYDRKSWEDYIDERVIFHIGKIVENYHLLPNEVKSAIHSLIDSAGYSYVIDSGDKYLKNNISVAVEKMKKHNET